jgi:hypothetical protein
MPTTKSTTEQVNETEEVTVEQVFVTPEDVTSQMKSSNLPRLGEQLGEGVVNPIVLAKFLGIKPQQVYNRIKAGKIETVQHNSTQKIVIPIEEATRFAASYLDRKARKAAQVEAELSSTDA